MPQRGDKWCLIKNGQRKSCEINRAYDPEAFFELEPGRPHGRICSGSGRLLQSRGLWQVMLQPEGSKRRDHLSLMSYCSSPLFQSDETTNRLPSLSLNMA